MTAPQSANYNLTVDKTTLITPPASVLNVDSVVIANHSSYLVKVFIGANQYALSPYSRDKFDNLGGGGPVQLVPSNPENAPNTLPAYAIAEWYSPGDSPPDAAYPTPLTASPYAIGAQVAAATLAAGVPNVILETVLASDVTTDTLGLLHVSGQASLTIFASSVNNIIKLQTNQTDPISNYTSRDVLSSSTTRLAVTGVYLSITNLGPDPVRLWIVGSNRPGPPRANGEINPGLSAAYSLPSTALVAGTRYVMPQLATVAPAVIQGLVFARFALAAGTLARGYWEVLDAAGTRIVICDTAELAAGASGLSITKLAALPAALDSISPITFTCTTAGTTVINAGFTKAD